MLRSYRTSAIVLRRVNFGETDRVLTLFSRERGKLGAIAKGARRIKSSMSGASELCSFSVFQLAMGANLEVVTQVELKNAFLGLRTSLERVSRAVYALEFCTEFLEDRQPQSELFDLLLSALYVLEKAPQFDWVLSGFEIQAMAILGYAPQTQICVSCGSSLTPGGLRFSAALGGIVCPRCAPQHRESIRMSDAVWPLLERLMEFGLPALGTDTPEAGAAQEVRRLVRAHVRFRAEREMKSARFVEQLRAEG